MILIDATCLSINTKIKFKLGIQSYQNIIIFLKTNNILFLSELELDFTKIPNILHGRGHSKNLIEYLSNNSDNNLLILKFLDYFISNIISIKYYNNKNLKFKFLDGSNWQNISMEVYSTYTPSTTTTTTTLTPTTTTTTTLAPTTTTTTLAPTTTTTTTTLVYDCILIGTTVNILN